jgi:UPF0755 protein
MKKLVFPILMVLAALAGLVAWPCHAPGGSATFSVPVGRGSSHIAHDLAEQGFVHSEAVFKALVTLTGSRHKLKAGEYEFPAGANAWQVLKVLRSGKSLLHEFVVPEGFSSVQIAGLLESEHLADRDKFLALAHSPEFAAKLSVNARTLEGYLFPDTYQVPRGLGEEHIIRMMVDRFQQKVGPDLLGEGRANGMKPQEVLVLASIVEREARLDVERPKVASVFLNRIRKNMRLESCATVRYAMGKYHGPVLDTDLHFHSPYNTYRHRGFPPGPICSPGLPSLQAAAHPAETSYLFFVVAGNGDHVFSKDFEDHKKAKFRYKRALKAGVVED